MTHHHPSHPSVSLNSTALSATIHCLAGCAVGEILGMILGIASGWDNVATAAVSIALAFVFGYSFTLAPLLRSGLTLRIAVGLAFASDTLSIAVMELVDTLIMLVVPGAMDAGLATPLFWGTMTLALALAGTAAFPINRWLISRGRGHAAIHRYHGGSHGSMREMSRHDHNHESGAHG